MGQIVNILLVALMAVLGGIPTVYMVLSLFVVLGQKIYGKIRYGRSLYD